MFFISFSVYCSFAHVSILLCKKTLWESVIDGISLEEREKKNVRVCFIRVRKKKEKET
jgi:hypothetical protein